ncbi:MAG TPA: Crp/Fnr family transcriptional regulator [Pyrinomonadaceae bacterium]|nr:Crp/Fnr family transcriptional regulator [Pyrinomonadaceae bacterium]
MSSNTQDRLAENRLLALLPADELDALRRHAEVASLRHGDHIIIPDEPIRDVYFPLTCLLSMVTTMEDGATVESGTIGREGMSGIPVILNAGQTTMPTSCQIPGEAVRVRAEHVRDLYEQSAEARRIFNRYVHTVVVVGSQSSACNALHRVEARMCRWLLMSSDGVASDEVNLTQENLATMLGVRRPGVTEVAGKLRSEGLIDYARGSIRILDRTGMEKRACECYGRVKGEYERLFGGA